MVRHQDGFVYRTETDPELMNCNGSCYQGEMFAKYHRLVELFGQPHDFFDDYKCDAEWYVEFDDGVVATIYNWKNGRNYCGFDAPTSRILWSGTLEALVLKRPDAYSNSASPNR